MNGTYFILCVLRYSLSKPLIIMNLEDHVLNLAAKRLAREASAGELRELNELLQENPALNVTLKLMFTWWDASEQQKDTDDNALLEKIRRHIQAEEAKNNINETEAGHKPVVKRQAFSH